MIINDSQKKKATDKQERIRKCAFYHCLDVFEFSVHVYVLRVGKIHSKVKAKFPVSYCL